MAPLGVQPPAPRRGRPSWSDGTFLAVVLLLVVAFAAGVMFDRSGGFGPAPQDTGSGSPTASGPVGTIGPGATVPPDAPANFGLVWDVLKLIQQHYVDRSAVTPTDITYGAIQGIVAALGDPGHTVFLTPDEVKSEQEDLSGQIVGIGVYLGSQGQAPVVVSVISGSPAQAAGLRAGDQIIAVDGQSALGLTLTELATRIRGKEGTQVRLTIVHVGSTSPVEVTITRRPITVPTVAWAMVPGTRVALVRLSQFSANASDELKMALAAARTAGASGVILDLRGNPGGLVDQAVAVADQFLRSGTIYIRQDANGKQTPVAAQGTGPDLSVPLVVLVDYGSASAAEIVAGALQGNHRAIVVGSRTFGTGTVLNTFDLPDGSALLLGVELWLTPDGRRIFPNGITPDQGVQLAVGVQPLEPDQVAALSASQVRSTSDLQLLAGLQALGAVPAGTVPYTTPAPATPGPSATP
jgi:carboxyl-terminal processing protease